MEGDLVYVKIENFIKRLEVYSLDDWIYKELKMLSRFF